MKSYRSPALVILAACAMLSAMPALARTEDADIKAGIKNYASCHYRAARKYFKAAGAKRLDEKDAEFVRAALVSMDDYRQYLDEIEKLELEFRRQKAGRASREALAGKHHTMAMLLTRGQFYLAMVEPHLARAIILEPGDAQARMDLGNAYYVGMKYQNAERSYESVIKLDPSNLNAYKMAGDSAVAIGDFDKARTHYEGLLKANSKALIKMDADEIKRIKTVINTLPRTYTDIAEFMKNGDHDKAEELLRKRISMNPGDYVAITELGSVYEEKGDRKTAIKLYKNAIRVAPDYPVSHLFLGRLYYLMRKYDDAIKELKLFKEKMDKLPSMDKDTKEMYINSLYYLAEVYYALKEFNYYRIEIEEILLLDPKQQDAHYAMGIYYYLYEHSRSRAYSSFKRVIAIDPESPAAKNAEGVIDFMRNNPDPRFSPELSFPERR